MFGPPSLPYTFTLDQEPYRIASVDLVAAAATGTWTAVLPDGLDDPSWDAYLGRLCDPTDRLDLVWTHHYATTIAARLLAAPWHVAVRLLAAVNASWMPWESWCVEKAFDPLDAPAHRVLAAAHAFAMSRCKDDKEARRLHTELYADPPAMARLAAWTATPLWSGGEEAALADRALAQFATR